MSISTQPESAPVSPLRQRMLEDMAMRGLRTASLPGDLKTSTSPAQRVRSSARRCRKQNASMRF